MELNTNLHSYSVFMFNGHYLGWRRYDWTQRLLYVLFSFSRDFNHGFVNMHIFYCHSYRRSPLAGPNVLLPGNHYNTHDIDNEKCSIFIHLSCYVTALSNYPVITASVWSNFNLSSSVVSPLFPYRLSSSSVLKCR